MIDRREVRRRVADRQLRRRLRNSGSLVELATLEPKHRTRHLELALNSSDANARLRAAAQLARSASRPQLEALLERCVAEAPELRRQAPDAVVALVHSSAETLPDSTVAALLAEELISDGSPFWAARARDALARLLAANGDEEKAADVLAAALGDTGDAPDARQLSLMALADLQLRLGETLGQELRAEAGGFALALAMGLPGLWAPEAARRLARLRTQEGRFLEAERLWSQARQLRGGDFRAADGLIREYAFGVRDRGGAVRFAADHVPGGSQSPDEALPDGPRWGGLSAAEMHLERLPFTSPGKNRMKHVLGAVVDGAPVVLLGAWDSPMYVKEQEMKIAAKWLNETRSAGGRLSRELIDQIVAASGAEELLIEPELEMLLAKVSAEGGMAVAPELSTILGWRKPFTHACWTFKNTVGRQHRPSRLQMRDYLIELAPGLGAAFMTVLRHDGLVPPRAEVAGLVDALWSVDPAHLPLNERHILVSALDRARKELVKGTGEPDIGRAQARAAILISICKRTVPDSTEPFALLDELRNAADAAHGLDRARAFDQHLEILDAEILAELSRVARAIPDDPTALITGDEAARSFQSSRTEGDWRYDAIVNAADLYRSLAVYYVRTRRLEEGRRAFRRSLRYYEAAVPHASLLVDWIRLYRRWATALTAAAQSVAGEDPAGAVRLAEAAISLAHRCLALNGIEPRTRGGVKILLATAHLARARAADEPDPDDVRELLIGFATDRTLTPSFRRRGINRVIDWLLAADDPQAALAVIDIAIEHDEALAADGWYTYRAATVAADANVEQLGVAIQRAADLLVLQPENATAAKNLFALVEQVSDDNSLGPLMSLDAADGATGDALLLARALRPLLEPDVEFTGYPLSDLVLDVAVGPRRTFQDAPPSVRLTRVLRLIGPLSRAIGAQGSRRGDTEVLLRAARLQEAALDERFVMDAWLDVARIALRARDPEMAARVRARLDPEKVLVSYIAVMGALLDLLAGRPVEAQLLLEAVDQREQARGVDPHPAVLEVQARAAVLSGDSVRARGLYERLVARRPYDPPGLLGLGKVLLESGDAAAACEVWIRCVTSLGHVGDVVATRQARLTARSLAKVCAEAPPEDERLDALVAQTMSGGTPVVAAVLADGIRETGRARPGLVEFLLQRRWNQHANRRIAQLFMATAVHDLLDPRPDARRADIGRMIEWAIEQGVVADMLAGAWTSYPRALLERRAAASGPALVHAPAVHGGKRGKAFIDHVVYPGAPRDASYWGEAHQLLGRVSHLTSELALALLSHIVVRMRERLDPQAAPASLEALLAMHSPQVVLGLLDVEVVNEGPATRAAAAVFDETSLLVLERVQLADRWTPLLDGFRRPVDRSGLVAVEGLLARGGFTMHGAGRDAYCFVPGVTDMGGLAVRAPEQAAVAPRSAET